MSPLAVSMLVDKVLSKGRRSSCALDVEFQFVWDVFVGDGESHPEVERGRWGGQRGEGLTVKFAGLSGMCCHGCACSGEGRVIVIVWFSVGFQGGDVKRWFGYEACGEFEDQGHKVQVILKWVGLE